MRLSPSSSIELSESLRSAAARREKIGGVDLRRVNRLLEYEPADMTATVETGMTLEAFQERLRQSGQWLPIDPPRPDRVTLHEIICQNLSGPRRFGYGTIRDYLIGIRAVLADGTLIGAGGKVVKNVAGYDLCKLFVGSGDSLGVPVEASFMLRPIPQMERFAEKRFGELDAAEAFLRESLRSDLVPVILDLHGLNQAGPGGFGVVIGLAGTADEIEYQERKLGELGGVEPGNLDYETEFWGAAPEGEVRRLSVARSELVPAIRGLGPVEFVARAGNGVVYYKGGPEPPRPDLPLKLIERVKKAYDPDGILPELKW